MDYFCSQLHTTFTVMVFQIKSRYKTLNMVETEFEKVQGHESFCKVLHLTEHIS